MVFEHPSPPVTGRKPGAGAFAILYTLESVTRALVLTTMPVQAHLVFGDDAKVSAVYFGVTLVGMIAGFAVPALIHRFRRRWVYSMGLLIGGLAIVLLAFETPFGQTSGQLLRALSSTFCTIALTLYVLDFVQRAEMIRYEPLRLFLATLPWGLGPPIGIELYQAFGPESVAAVGVVSSLVSIGFFWYLRLTENPAVAAATKPPPNPLKSIGRFAAQPRLRLAWLIAFGRSGWWSLFFVYPALYFEAKGVDKSWAGLLAGAGNIMLVVSPLVGWMGRRVGIRRPIMISFFGGGLSTIAVAFVFDDPLLVGIALMIGSVFVVVLDGLGNIPFLRSVRPLERPQMTSVFRTYIDLGSLLPFAVFVALLQFFDQRAVYVSYGLLMLIVGVVSVYLPKRM
jgi:MFS family permease